MVFTIMYDRALYSDLGFLIPAKLGQSTVVKFSPTRKREEAFFSLL